MLTYQKLDKIMDYCVKGNSYQRLYVVKLPHNVFVNNFTWINELMKKKNVQESLGYM